MTFDNVNRPSHYTEGRKFETIEVIEDWELGFCLGNTVKYISRAGRKVDSLEDLQKARWYLDRAISNEIAAQEKETFNFSYKEVLTDAALAPEFYWDPSLGPIEPTPCPSDSYASEASAADWEDFWNHEIWDSTTTCPARPEWDNDDKWMLDSTKTN